MVNAPQTVHVAAVEHTHTHLDLASHAECNVLVLFQEQNYGLLGIENTEPVHLNTHTHTQREREREREGLVIM